MARVTIGDRDAYGAIFDRHAERLARTAYLMLHDQALVEDAVQETFTRGLSYIGTYWKECDPGPWLYTICLNVCRKQLREKESGKKVVESVRIERRNPLRNPFRGVVTSVMRRETRTRLLLAIEYLTRSQREVFVLHYIEELPYETVSQILGMTPGAARALGHRARALLREKLPEKDLSVRT